LQARVPIASSSTSTAVIGIVSGACIGVAGVVTVVSSSSVVMTISSAAVESSKSEGVSKYQLSSVSVPLQFRSKGAFLNQLSFRSSHCWPMRTTSSGKKNRQGGWHPHWHPPSQVSRHCCRALLVHHLDSDALQTDTPFLLRTWRKIWKSFYW